MTPLPGCRQRKLPQTSGQTEERGKRDRYFLSSLSGRRSHKKKKTLPDDNVAATSYCKKCFHADVNNRLHCSADVF